MAWDKHTAAGHVLMRNVLLICLFLTGCSTEMDAPEKRTHDFYTFYLTAFVTDSKEDNLDSLKMRVLRNIVTHF